MGKHQVEDIRDVAIVGHEVAGKTTLADALLFNAKAVTRQGSVDDGTSVSDYDDEEKANKYSIDTTVLHADYQGKRIYLLDAPGKPDFVGQALGAMNAADNAVIVISAPAGIQVNTRRMFIEAGKRNMARILVINRLDSENIQFTQLLDNIRESFGNACALFNAPVGVGPNFKDVVSVIDPPESTPDGCPVNVADERSKLVDAIVESDEELMEQYLEEGTVSAADLNKALPKALATGTVIPIFCTSAKNNIGVGALLNALAEIGLSPVTSEARPTVKSEDGDAAPIEPKADGPFAAQVFKVLNDKFVGNLSFFRVYSGKITNDQQIVNERTGKSSRNTGLLLIQGKDQKSFDEAIPGDIVAVAKIEDLCIGDSLNTGGKAVALTAPKFPLPMFGLAVEPKARGDEQKISSSLQKIADEDPTFNMNRDMQTKELVISGMSQLHLDVVQQRLKRRYDLEVTTKEPKIPYRETITNNAEANYRHKKQSGGRGQFGEVHLRVFPLTRDITSEEILLEKFANKSHFEKMRAAHYDETHNFAFIDTIVGGTIPNQFMPAVEKGCKELLQRGALAGYQMQDVAVEVYFGKDHPVDSSETAFKTAGRIAFRNAFLEAHPVLLEPIVDIEITIPSKYTGAILGDLNTKRARIENQDSLPGDIAVVKGKAPLAEVTRYAAQLGSITQGTGSYSMEFSHYDVVPPNVQQQIVAKSKVADDEED